MPSEQPVDAPSLQPGDVIADKYLVVRVLGSGGMGVVVAARDRHLGRMVAIKFLRQGMSTRVSVVARFEREARVVASLTGEHVARVFDFGRFQGGEPYIVMELLEGETLAERLLRAGPLPVAEAARFILEACEGLAEAHAAGVVHRDLKPANLFISQKNDGTESIKLIDFGISKARFAESSITNPLDMIGTPAYMAPEQLEAAGSVDARADVWSLGAALYEAVTGKLPFPAETLVQVVSSVLLADPTPVLAHDPNLPPELAAVAHKCLSKDPSARYASVVELARALAPFVHGGESLVLRIARVAAHRPPISVDHPADIPPGEPAPAAGSSVVTRKLGPPVKSDPAPAVQEETRAADVPPSVPPVAPSRRRFLALGALGAASLAGGVWLTRRVYHPRRDSRAAASAVAFPGGPPLAIGVLHSLTGTMASSESPLVDAALLGIDRVNASGGVLGRRLEALVRDGRSRAETFALEARRLLEEDRVPVVLGCWTSSARRAVRPLFEEHKRLLLYSVQYEGMGSSSSIIYLGAAPNQQIIPAVRWAFAFLERRRMFLVGSDYVFPRVANEIIKDELHRLGATVAGEEYLPLGTSDVAEVARRIKASGATLVLNTINGDTNTAFLRALRAAGVTSEAVPVLSFSLDASGCRDLDPGAIAGDYLAWSYFEAFDSEANREFLRALRERFGPRPATDAMATTYSAVLWWAAAVARAGSTELADVQRAAGEVEVATPLGALRVSPATSHAVKSVAIGQIARDGAVKVVWSAPQGVDATPYPDTRSRADWDALLARLYKGWGERWERPQ